MSQYNLKISNLYKLLIGDGFNLFVDGTGTNPALAKRWDGTQWNLIYEAKVDGRAGRIMYFNGTAWQNASIK